MVWDWRGQRFLNVSSSGFFPLPNTFLLDCQMQK